MPFGALADRYSRRGALVAAGVLQAGGYALWIAAPSFPAFAAGFVLWGLGGALVSGAFEALLYDGLAAVGAESRYPRVLGWITSAGLLVQLPAAVAAALLFSWGGHDLAGWVSVGCCLAAAVLASRLPDSRPATHEDDGLEAGDDGEPSGYLTVLRSGLAEAAGRPAIRAAVLAVAVLGGLDGLEEYDTLLARDWGMATAQIPVAVLGVPLAGAAGAAFGGRAGRLRPSLLAALLGVGVTALVAAALVRHPAGLVGVSVFYGLYRLVLVVVDARLQERIEGPSRATVTSLAGFGTEVSCLLLFGAWALGGVLAVAALVALIAAALPWLLRTRS